MTTERHGFLTWSAGFTQSDIILNDLLDNLDVKLGLSVKSRTTDGQPGTGAVSPDPAPTAGDCYIMTASATGAAWSTFNENDVVIYRDGAWTSFTPINGWVAWVEDDSNGVTWDGSAWTVTSGDITAAETNISAIVWDIYVETVADQDYEFTFDAPYPGTVATLRTKTQSGSCTVTGYVVDNSASPATATAFGGSANSASTTAEEQSHASASPLNNSWAKGDTVKITVSSNSSATDLMVTLYGARTDL